MKEHPMKYMLLIYGNEAAMQAASKAQTEQTMGAYVAYTDALRTAGVIVGGDRLQPSTVAAPLRGADGKSKGLHGPHAAAKEHLGGHFPLHRPHLAPPFSGAPP